MVPKRRDRDEIGSESDMPQLRIFDPEVFRQMAQRIEGPDADDSDLSFLPDAADDPRARYLRSLANDPRRGNRDLLIPDAQAVTRLLSVEAHHPNFAAAAGVYIRAARLSALTQAPLNVPPILLVGPPGVGKSHFARALAEALRTNIHEIAGPGLDDNGVLNGHSVGWRNARAGVIARALIDGANAQPVFVLDELDKVPTWHESDPLDTLHAALEPANARNFIDSFLEAPIAADRILWIATANDLSGLRQSLLDRFLVLPVSAPDINAAIAITKRIYRSVAEPHRNVLAEDLDDDLAREMTATTPRRIRLVFQLAIGFAAAEKRCKLSCLDLENARRLLTSDDRKSIGFLAR
jgi:hypothetical protein